MGNAMCAGGREHSTENSFGMLCRRPYDKPIVIKFERVYTKKRKKKKRRKLNSSATPASRPLVSSLSPG